MVRGSEKLLVLGAEVVWIYGFVALVMLPERNTEAYPHPSLRYPTFSAAHAIVVEIERVVWYQQVADHPNRTPNEEWHLNEICHPEVVRTVIDQGLWPGVQWGSLSMSGLQEP